MDVKGVSLKGGTTRRENEGFCPLCLEFYKEFKDPEAEEKCWKLVDLLFSPLPMDVDSNSTQAVEIKTVIIVSRDEIDDESAKKLEQGTA